MPDKITLKDFLDTKKIDIKKCAQDTGIPEKDLYRVWRGNKRLNAIRCDIIYDYTDGLVDLNKIKLPDNNKLTLQKYLYERNISLAQCSEETGIPCSTIRWFWNGRGRTSPQNIDIIRNYTNGLVEI